ncbi:MAG: ABC transporter permease [Gemmatimonadaceae bacterium]
MVSEANPYTPPLPVDASLAGDRGSADHGIGTANASNTAHDDRVTLVIAPPGRWPRIRLDELWQYRQLLYFMVWRDMKVRYAQTVMGVSWAVLQPVISTLIFTIIFGRLARVSSDGLPYGLFALAAMVPWGYFSTAYTNAAASLVANANMVGKVYFPRLIFPLTPILAGGIDLLIGSLVLAVAMVWYRVAPSPLAVAVVPAMLIVLAATAIGLGAFLAAVNVEYRDVKHVLPFATQLLMYASPLVYPLSLVPPRYRALYAINPIVGVVEGLRSSLFQRLPLAWSVVGVSSASAALLLVGGVFYFKRVESRFADLI